MRRPRLVAALFAALALAAPVAAHAQRDTIRLGGRAEPRDTVRLSGDAEAPADTAPARGERSSRYSRPFAVEGSGEVAPRPAAREAVWLPADTVRARRIAARRDAAAADSEQVASADSAADDAADSAPAPRRRTTARDTAATPRRRTASRDDGDADAADAPPARRASARDTAATRRRTASRDDDADAPPARRASARDTAATRRRTASRDDDADAPSARRASARDTTATRRRTASRDDGADADAPPARRASARDTAATRRAASRDTATRRTTARPRTHTVAGGETLYGIARRYGVTTAQIRAVNPDIGDTLERGTVLRLPAGARVPGSAAASARDTETRRAPARGDADDDERPAPRRSADRDADSDRPATRRAADRDTDADRPATRRATAAERTETTRPAAGRARRHTVAAGETLYGLARRYGVTVDAIRRANRLDGDTVRPGQTLTIPAATPQR